MIGLFITMEDPNPTVIPLHTFPSALSDRPNRNFPRPRRRKVPSVGACGARNSVALSVAPHASIPWRVLLTSGVTSCREPSALCPPHLHLQL